MAVQPTEIPLVFGITGHRNIPPSDFEQHGSEIERLFRQYRARYRRTPFVLLTSLAEGGDRIAAHAALRAGVTIIPVLPMSQAEYEKDFSSESSLKEFHDVLGKASPPIILGTVPRNATAIAGQARQLLYERAGVYVALHCHVLIALWDGYDAEEAGAPLKTGATGCIVGFWRSGVLPEGRPLPEFCRADASMLDAQDPGPLIHIPVRRAGSARAPVRQTDQRPVNSAATHRASAAVSQAAVFSHLETFNRDVQKIGPARRNEIGRSADCLLPKSEMDKYPELAGLLAQFATTDVLAMVFRDRVQRVLLWLSLLGLAAFIAFEIFAHISSTADVLASYLATLVVPWFVYWFLVRPLDWQAKYLDYRALAEALRIQFYWRLSGIPLNAADLYLRRQTGDLAWIRYAARACNIGSAVKAGADEIKLARTYWIEDQAKWLSKTARSEHATFRAWNIWLAIAYICGIGFAAALLFALQTGLTGGWVNFFIIAMGLAPAIAAVIGFFLERRAYEAHTRQYQLMADLYDRVAHALGRTSDTAAQLGILEAIGREALAENGDWVFTHRQRRVAPALG